MKKKYINVRGTTFSLAKSGGAYEFITPGVNLLDEEFAKLHPSLFEEYVEKEKVVDVNFDSFLNEEDILDEVETNASEKVNDYQLEKEVVKELEEEKLPKKEILKMKKAELVDYAKELNIELKGDETKKQLTSLILEA